MRQYKYFGITEDQKINGVWAHTISVPGGYYQTRSGQLWRGIKDRLDKPSYEDVNLNFVDYQDFAEFCLSQPLYTKLDSSGNFYHIDKDLKGLDLREYSRLTCLFIPSCLNTSMKDIRKFFLHGQCGVSFHDKRGKFRAYCNDGGGKQIHLGYYGIKHEAQNAWINQKCEQILLALNKEEICQETKVYTDMLVTRLKGAIDAS